MFALLKYSGELSILVEIIIPLVKTFLNSSLKLCIGLLRRNALQPDALRPRIPVSFVHIINVFVVTTEKLLNHLRLWISHLVCSRKNVTHGFWVCLGMLSFVHFILKFFGQQSTLVFFKHLGNHERVKLILLWVWFVWQGFRVAYNRHGLCYPCNRFRLCHTCNRLWLNQRLRLYNGWTGMRRLVQLTSGFALGNWRVKYRVDSGVVD